MITRCRKITECRMKYLLQGENTCSRIKEERMDEYAFDNGEGRGA